LMAFSAIGSPKLPMKTATATMPATSATCIINSNQQQSQSRQWRHMQMKRGRGQGADVAGCDLLPAHAHTIVLNVPCCVHHSTCTRHGQATAAQTHCCCRIVTQCATAMWHHNYSMWCWCLVHMHVPNRMRCCKCLAHSSTQCMRGNVLQVSM
jgi:hypothetical protein